MEVVACMVLHNFIHEHGSEDLDFAHFGRDPHFVPIILERYNRYTITSNGSTSEANVATMDVFCDDLPTALALAWN